jgi:hypothetical protein
MTIPKNWTAKHYTSEEWPLIKSDGIELECAGATREQAEEISTALNMHDGFVVFAELVTRLNEDEGLSPAALGYLIDRAKELLKKAGVQP